MQNSRKKQEEDVDYGLAGLNPTCVVGINADIVGQVSPSGRNPTYASRLSVPKPKLGNQRNPWQNPKAMEDNKI